MSTYKHNQDGPAGVGRRGEGTSREVARRKASGLPGVRAITVLMGGSKRHMRWGLGEQCMDGTTHWRLDSPISINN